jgi:hypothetical protein
MGSVWQATHLGLDIPCAVKFIEGEGSQHPEMQGRFEREAKAAAQLRSPHVVQILDHGVWSGTPYIAMELLDGEDLGKRLARLGRLRPHELLWIVVQVGRALTKAHSLGIVHRDLKPDNIFLVRDDDREIAKVLDFGIAKASGPSIAGGSTRTGAMLGTPYYMSPEQAQGIRAVDARSDLWSLAVIVFQAITGHRPFESEALGDLLMKIIVAPVPLPSHYMRDLPPGFDAWWAKASRRDPAQRYQSSKELCDGLTLAFGSSAADAADPTPPAFTPMGGVPPPGNGPTPQPQASSTGAPIAQTFAGAQRGVNARRALVLGGALALIAAVVAGVSFAVNGSKEAAVGGTATPATMKPPVAAAAVDAMVLESLATSTTLPPVSTTLSEAAPPASAAIAPPPPARPPPAAKHPLPPVKPPPVAKPPEPPPNPIESKKKPVDLGF